MQPFISVIAWCECDLGDSRQIHEALIGKSHKFYFKKKKTLGFQGISVKLLALY